MPRRTKKRTVAREVIGYDGAPPIVEDTVPDPYEAGARLKVRRRETILKRWHERRHIDDAQRAAGESLAMIYERAQLRSPSSMDYTRPAVDGGRMQEPLTDSVMVARRELLIVRNVIGATDYALLTRVICEGGTIEQEAARWGNDALSQRYIARRIRDALAVLADFKGTKGPVRRVRIRFEEVEG